MHEILDNNTYLNINKNSTNKMNIEIRAFLIRRKNRKYIDKFIYKKLYVSDGTIEILWASEDTQRK